MNKKIIIFALVAILLTTFAVSRLCSNKETKDNSNGNSENNTVRNSTLKGTILEISDSELTLKDQDNVIYTFNNISKDLDFEIGQDIVLEYTGVLDKNKELQDTTVISCAQYENSDEIPDSWQDNGIFSDYYTLAYNKLKTLSLEEKIGQIFLVRVPETNKLKTIKDYKIGGYLLFQRDFDNKTKAEVIDMIKEFQSNSGIPLLIASDEEGGTVTRISKNSNLVSTPFKSSQELYSEGGYSLIKEDTINKSKILDGLGINLNLAPVVDVSTNSSDYMYKRSFGKDAGMTSKYAETVISASKSTNVSYTLKHFPGYGNNVDTHTGQAIDNRSYDDIINNDILPFKAGIEAGAEAVLISHNIVNSIDSTNPASLSPSVHNLLRNELGFTGITITDDLSMQAITDYVTGSATVKAILAGNDLLIVTDYNQSIEDVKAAISDKTLSEDIIDKLAFRVLAWKYYKGLMMNSYK